MEKTLYDEINDLKKLKDSIHDLNKKLVKSEEAINDKLHELYKQCDHRYPDGSAAAEELGSGYDVCRICHTMF